jgi:acyl carrier protein
MQASQYSLDELTDMIRATWAGVLEHSDFDDDNSFFTVGGHSLLASKVIARLGRRLGRRIPMQLIFDHRSVSALATAVSALLAEDQSGS